MNRILPPLLLLSLIVAFAVVTRSQTRERRVSTSTSASPSSTSSQSAPVLRGNNNSQRAGETKPAGTTTQDTEEVDAGDVIRVNTTLVTIPLSVMDRDGRYVPNLTKQDFRLWENGIEQEVAYFSSVDKPFSVVLMIDTSNSTRFRLEEIQDAAIEFVNQLRVDDRVMVVSFDDRIRVLSDFTSNRYQLREAIRETETGDGTRLYDAVDMVINERLNRITGRKAIVLFTDGVDTTSRRAQYATNVGDAEELDALIYPVQYDTYEDMNNGGGGWPGAGRPQTPIDILGQILGGMSRGGRRGGGGGRRGGGAPGTSRADYDVANQYLRDLAEKTGARKYEADTTQNLSLAFSNIAEELRRQYSLGYYPKLPAQAGERRQIRVKVNEPNLAVRARDSYVFNPTAGSTPQDTAAQSAPVLRRKFSTVY